MKIKAALLFCITLLAATPHTASAASAQAIFNELNSFAQARNYDALIQYYSTGVTNDTLKPSLDWIRDKANLDTDPIYPLLYSDLLTRVATGYKAANRNAEYKSTMDLAAQMFIYADTTLMVDIDRCADQSVRELQTGIRATRLPVVSEHLKNSDEQTRRSIINSGMEMEKRIVSRPPNPWPCTRSVASFPVPAVQLAAEPIADAADDKAGEKAENKFEAKSNQVFVGTERWEKRRERGIGRLERRYERLFFAPRE